MHVERFSEKGWMTLELLGAHGDKAWSFCDACSFAVMERLESRRTATFDDHFRQIGRFEVIGL